MCRAVPRVALQQLATGRERERQDDPLGLGELERPLQRRLRCTGFAELVAGRRVE